jgi:hypothetical protein
MGIDGSVVDANFVVQVGTRAATAEPYISDGVATMDVLSGGNREV